MISALLIVALFVGGLAGLALLGRRVRNPADLEVTYADWYGILYNEFRVFERIVGEQLVPAITELGQAVAAFGQSAVALVPVFDGLAIALLNDEAPPDEE